jgi:NitT/TauT family transport system permease protein
VVREIFKCFTPNRPPSRMVGRSVVGFEIILLLLFWATSPASFFPSPLETISAMGELYSNGLVRELLVSLALNAQALALATVLSLLVAYSSLIYAFRPPAVFASNLRFLPEAALTFIFTMMMPTAHALKLALMVFAISVFFISSMLDVVDQVEREKYDLARTLRMGEWRALWEVIVLGQADKAFDALRQNAAMGWMMLTLVESTVREGGIGTVLMDQSHHFRLSAIVALLIVMGIVGFGQDQLLLLVKKIVCPYAYLKLEKK